MLKKITIISSNWSFVEKDLCDARPKPEMSSYLQTTCTCRSVVPPGSDILWPRAELGHLLDEVHTQMRCSSPGTGIWWSRTVLHKVVITLASSWGHDDIKFYPPSFTNLHAFLIDAFLIDRKYYLFHHSAVPTISSLTAQTTTPTQRHQVNYTMLLTQTTYAVLYKHSALL